MAASTILSFLHRQLQSLAAGQRASCESPSCSLGDAKPTAGERCQDMQACFQGAAASLAQMHVHARQVQRQQAMSGAQQAAEFVARSVLPLDGQMLQEAALMGFFHGQIQQQDQGSGLDAEAATVDASDVNRRLPGHSLSSVGHFPAPPPRSFSSQQGAATPRVTECRPSSPFSKKRGHDSMLGVQLDPAFEQAFKRQRQTPPTPPRYNSRR